jgi:hypothetical protein
MPAIEAFRRGKRGAARRAVKGLNVPEIELDRELRVPPGPASQALEEVLNGIAEQKGGWRGFALHVRLADLHLPDVGYVAIPIALAVNKDPAKPESFKLKFSAVNSPATFPTFEGTIYLKPDGPSQSLLHLDGAYDVPLHLFGRLLDATLIAGVATRTLENFIDDIAAACTATVDQREEEFVRYRFYSLHS